MAIKIIVNGALGKMGSMTSNAILKNKKFSLIGKSNSTSELKKLLKTNKCDIVIDFTNPNSVYENTKTIIQNKVRPVIGTTGLTTRQINTLKKMCAKKLLGGMIAPNFSLAMIHMIKCASLLAPHFPDIEIIEMHHNQKADIPSGTSLKTAEIIKDSLKSKSKKNIPIHSIRLPGLLAHQEIIFGGMGETLTMRHDTLDRTCFVPGIFLACEKVMKLRKLVYGLEQII